MSVATLKVFSRPKNMADPENLGPSEKKKKIGRGRPPLETWGGNSMKAKT